MSQKVKGGGGSDTQKCRDEPLTDTDRTRNNSSTPVFTSELTSVVLTWSRCVRGVMGHTPLPRLSKIVSALYPPPTPDCVT